jgi:hypothetical protein
MKLVQRIRCNALYLKHLNFTTKEIKKSFIENFCFVYLFLVWFSIFVFCLYELDLQSEAAAKLAKPSNPNVYLINKKSTQ